MNAISKNTNAPLLCATALYRSPPLNEVEHHHGKPLQVPGLAFLAPEKHKRAADHDRPHAGPNRDVDRLFVLYR